LIKDKFIIYKKTINTIKKAKTSQKSAMDRKYSEQRAAINIGSAIV
jgi:hypothetical protein